MKPIGPEIRKIRVTKQLTLAEVAKAANITIKELQAIEINRHLFFSAGNYQKRRSNILATSTRNNLIS